MRELARASPDGLRSEAQRAISALRSLLFVPGNRPDQIAKAARFEPDALIVDLEDAVPPADKSSARNHLAALLAERAELPILVRSGSARSPQFDEDLDAVVRPGLSALLLPQAEEVTDITAADQRIASLERERGLIAGSIPLIVMPESALGIRNLYEMLRASARVVAAVFAGAEGGDLFQDLGCRSPLDGTELLYARSKVVLDARAAKITSIIDGAYSALRDLDGFRDDTSLGRRMGYTGRVAVHPGQVAVINDAFSYSQQEIDTATAVIDVFEQAAGGGRGAIEHDGQLLDYASLRRAQAVLAAARRQRD